MKKLLLPAFLALAIAGCTASGDMRDADPTPPPGPDEAKVVVHRSAVIGGIDNFPIYAVRGGTATLLGFTETDAYFEIRLAPGRVLFATWCEGEAFVEATLQPGETYYLEAWSKFGLLASRPGLARSEAPPEDLRCRELDPLRSLEAAWSRRDRLEEVLRGYPGIGPYAKSDVDGYGATDVAAGR